MARSVNALRFLSFNVPLLMTVNVDQSEKHSNTFREEAMGPRSTKFSALWR